MFSYSELAFEVCGFFAVKKGKKYKKKTIPICRGLL